MADTSLNENRIGLLIWQTSNLWQSKLRKELSKYKISFNEYIIIENEFANGINTKNFSFRSVFKYSQADTMSLWSKHDTWQEIWIKTTLDNQVNFYFNFPKRKAVPIGIDRERRRVQPGGYSPAGAVAEARASNGAPLVRIGNRARREGCPLPAPRRKKSGGKKARAT